MYFLCITLKKRVFRFEFKFNWRLPYSGWCRVVNICLPTPRMEVKSDFSETSSWSLSESGLKSIENFRRILILVQVSQKGGWSAYILAYPWGEKLCLKKVIICLNDNLVDSVSLQILLNKLSSVSKDVEHVQGGSSSYGTVSKVGIFCSHS